MPIIRIIIIPSVLLYNKSTKQHSNFIYKSKELLKCKPIIRKDKDPTSKVQEGKSQISKTVERKGPSLRTIEDKNPISKMLRGKDHNIRE